MKKEKNLFSDNKKEKNCLNFDFEIMKVKRYELIDKLAELEKRGDRRVLLIKSLIGTVKKMMAERNNYESATECVMAVLIILEQEGIIEIKL